jgi:hypothetical protein
MFIEILFDITDREDRDPSDKDIDEKISQAINEACSLMESEGLKVTYKLIKIG